MPLALLKKKLGLPADHTFDKDTLVAAMKHYNLTPNRAAHFFAQAAHESGDFKVFKENLNYSAEGLVKVFHKYFADLDHSTPYARNPEKIANKVYASRMGNGPEASGDGWKFRGRGAIQLTGHDNYKAFSDYIKHPEIMTNPDVVATDYAFESALWFFEKKHIWAMCDLGVTDDAILKVTKAVNGGTIGLDDRVAKTKKYAAWLA
jgi:putative chitinase